MAARYYERNTSGMNFDRFLDRFDESTLVTMKRHYWTAKQLIRNKMGKKEDEHLLASDADLDSKLTLFRSVRDTSYSLLASLENYQAYLHDVVLVENELAHYLKGQGKLESREETARVMVSVGRAMIYSSIMRVAIRQPLVRFYQELHVFAERAIHDCHQTVDAAERARLEYRGSLLWMKKVSEEVDPESQQMDGFREAQNTVRQNKERLDKLKVDVLQKVDLLAASRSNLLSHLLGKYLHTMACFYGKTGKVYSTLAENLSVFQHYEFEILTDLIEPSKKVAKKLRQESMDKEREARASTSSQQEEEEREDQEPAPPANPQEALERKYLIGLPDSRPRPKKIEEFLFGRLTPEPDQTTTEEEERPESPLGIMNDEEEAKDGLNTAASPTKPSVNIGPLPASLIDLNAAVPRLAPPPTVIPNDSTPSTSTNNAAHQTALLTLEDLPSDEYFNQQLFPMVKKTQTRQTNKTEGNNIMDLLNLHETDASGNSFPNPFGESRNSEWDLLLSQCDGQQYTEDLL